jgi:hypothetical protein
MPEDQMIGIREPICLTCSHTLGYKWGKCDAFIYGIPEAILKGEADHHDPWPDGGDAKVYTPMRGEKDPVTERLNSGICLRCKNLSRNDVHPAKCTAFPGGIPDRVLDGTFLHINSYVGDNGIMFDPITTKKP